MAYKSKRTSRSGARRSTGRVQRATGRGKSKRNSASGSRGSNRSSRGQTVRIVVEHRNPASAGTVGAGTPLGLIGMKPSPKPRTRPQF